MSRAHHEDGVGWTDLALAEAAASGDRSAQRTLLLRVLPQLRAVANAMLGRGSDAEDLAQQSGLKVLEKVGSFRGDAKLERWARQVATRACIDHIRRHKRRRELSSQTPAEPLIEMTPSPAWESLPRPIAAYLDELSDAQRQVVVMRHALDYSVNEIAQMLEIPVDTAKSRLLYGRRALRKSIRRDLQTKALTHDGPLRLAKGNTA